MKGKSLFQKSKAWVERLNNYPGCDQKELSVRVQLWVGSAYALLHVLLLWIGFLIFAPEAMKVLTGYGYFLVITMTTYLILTPRLRKNYKLVNAIHLTILSVGTFIIIFT